MTCDSQDLKNNFGFVLMMDALGVSNYTNDECLKYLKLQSELISILNGIKEKNHPHSYHYQNSQISKFGDTLIICYPFDSAKISEDEQISIIWDVSIASAIILVWGITNGILFRGCISVGEYISAENTVLGPAIFDANEWYEIANWFGVIITPKSQLFIDSLLERSNAISNGEKVKTKLSDVINTLLISYEVPLSKSPNNLTTTKKFKTVGWPGQYYQKTYRELTTSKMPPRAQLLSQLFHIAESKEGEPKFQNGINYFDWYCQRLNLDKFDLNK
jgi:hypothetical protein